MLFKNTLVLFVTFLLSMNSINPIFRENLVYQNVFKVAYSFEVELQGVGPLLKPLYGEDDEYASKVVSIAVSYTYRMKVYVPTDGDVHYEYWLISFDIYPSNELNRSFYELLNTTLSSRLDVVEKSVGVPVNPRFVLWIDYRNASINFSPFSEFCVNPRFVLIDREFPAFYKVDVFENRNYTHSYMVYIASSCDVVSYIPLYLYYYSQLSSNDASEQVRLKVVMRSSIEMDDVSSRYVVRSVRVVFANKASASILLASTGGGASLDVKCNGSEVLVSVKVVNDTFTYPYRLILIINEPLSINLLNTNGSLRLVSSSSRTIYSTELTRGDYTLKLVFDQNVSRFDLSESSNVIYLIESRPLNLSPQAFVFAVLVNIFIIQFCFLLGKRLVKWLVD